MIITPVPFELTLINDHTRSEGVHVSNTIRKIGFDLGYLKPEYLGAEMDVPRVSLGCAWEDWVFPRQHPETLYHPGEIIKDGIAMTCDGLAWFDSDKKRVEECKLTWKSMKRALDLEAEWMWLSQTKSYCWGWETQYARYCIYWINGNYKYGTDEGKPQYRLYDLEFTYKELKDNWQMIKNAQ